MFFLHGLFFFTVSVQVDSKASKMLDTVNAEMNDTDRDNGGTSQQDTEVVTSCHANNDKDQVVRTREKDQSKEVDSANIDGLAEKMGKSCCISSDRQKVSVGMNETSNDQHKASALEEEIGGDQKKVSSLEEIGSDQKKVSSNEEEIGSDQKKVSSVENEIGSDQKKVSSVENDIGSDQKKVSSVENEIGADQKKVLSVENESSNDQEKVREGHTSDDSIAVEKVGLGGQDKIQQTKEPSVSRAPQEGVEHECPSPTDLETGEVSDYDDDDVVVQIRVHEASDGEEEDFKKLTDAMG